MKVAIRTKLCITLAVMLCLSELITSCTGSEPVFVESGPPQSRIVVKTDAWDNCDTAQGVTQFFETKDTRSQETAWWVEGKAGVGGKIPFGFLVPSLDIEAAITSHYGSKETRTWQSTYSYTYDVPAYRNTVLAVFYQEITRKGIIRVQGKEIEYEYPAELTVLDHRLVDLDCEPRLNLYMICLPTAGEPPPALSPGFEHLAGTWRLSGPSNAEIVKLDIEIQDFYVILHAQTDGSSGVADWGIRYQCIWADPMELKFDQLIFKTTTLTLQEVTGNQLRATVVDQYHARSVTIPPQVTEYIFMR
jgi:hypothetical protein